MDEKSLRRRRLVTISHDQVLRLLTRKNPSGFVLIDEFDLPEDCKVISVHADALRGAFVFVIQSDAFDEVEDCFIPPDHPVTARVVKIAVKEPER